ncbi:amino acid ABC transporter permease, partial [Mesorhizobium sp. M7D.F.Ca.US.004.03.1.1]|uniref:amino acid ABC transporter permease n=1 Tax=Mesorhizobium sp. M7D.F.Ca.US.004.03.1.1 TaxID=2496702 RepID=UPI0013E375EB
LLTSLIFAIPLAIARTTSIAILRSIAIAYSWFFRAIPSLTILFFMYYGLPALGIYLDAWTSAILGLSLTAAAYMTEIIRAGIRSVPAGQYESARALGMPFWLSMRRIILPQTMRIIIPPMASEFTAVLKGSALASLVAVAELTGQASALISLTYQPIPILASVALAYLALNSVIVGGQAFLERRYRLG